MWSLAGSTDMHEKDGNMSQYFLSGVAITLPGVAASFKVGLPPVVKSERVDSSSTTFAAAAAASTIASSSKHPNASAFALASSTVGCIEL